MGLYRRILVQGTFIKPFSSIREFRFSFNWLRISSVWMLIVFGFYGWGTSTISAITSIPFILMNVSIFVIFSLFFAFGDLFSTLLRENVVIKSSQIYTVFGIFILLCFILENVIVEWILCMA